MSAVQQLELEAVQAQADFDSALIEQHRRDIARARDELREAAKMDAPNKHPTKKTTERRAGMVQAFELAFQGCGGVPRLVKWANENYGDFLRIYASLARSQAHVVLGVNGAGYQFAMSLEAGELEEGEDGAPLSLAEFEAMARDNPASILTRPAPRVVDAEPVSDAAR